MITLTTPPEINSVLGGNAPVPYNKLVVGPFSLNPITQTVSGNLVLTSTANPNMQKIDGTLQIGVLTSTLEIQVPSLDFYRRVVLTSPQSAAVLAIIQNAQNALESGLITLGVLAGAQSAGA